MRYKIKSIPVWPFVKLMFPLNLLSGFIIGLLAAMFFSGLVSFYNDLIQLRYPGFEVELIPLETLMVVLPFLFSLGNGFCVTFGELIIVLMYNMLSKFIGGFVLELENLNGSKPSTPQPPSFQNDNAKPLKPKRPPLPPMPIKKSIETKSNDNDDRIEINE